MIQFSAPRVLAAAMIASGILLSACSESVLTAVGNPPASDPASPKAQISLPCTASVSDRSISCGTGVDAETGAMIIGSQNVYLRINTSNVTYSAEIFRFDVTIQNLMNETIGSPAEQVPDPEGVRLFFSTGPTVTSGTGSIAVNNEDGTATITSFDQPYFSFLEVLDKDEVSSSKMIELSMPSTVGRFNFTLLVETDITPMLVINEILANPANPATSLETDREWVEIYNAGSWPVDLQGFLIADSAASGRRPYHLIASSVVVPPGGYAVLGNTTNTTNNGGAPVDYAYGGSITFANSLDAFKISRVHGTDTLTVDRVQYASAAISAQDGISRELKNPALDNANIDGSNWANALVTAVFGSSGRGTPKAQNSTYTP